MTFHAWKPNIWKFPDISRFSMGGGNAILNASTHFVSCFPSCSVMQSSQTVKWLLRLWINMCNFINSVGPCVIGLGTLVCLSVFSFVCIIKVSSVLILMINWRGHLHLPSSAGLVSDFSLTNSLATSSVERWERIRSAVVPVSSMLIRGPKGHQHTQLFRSATSRSCSTAIPTTRSARPKE